LFESDYFQHALSYIIGAQSGEGWRFSGDMAAGKTPPDLDGAVGAINRMSQRLCEAQVFTKLMIAEIVAKRSSL